MKKCVVILSLIFFISSLKSQETLFFDNFESYNDGDSVVNLSSFQGWGGNGCGTAVLDPGNGAGSSDQYFETVEGYMALQIIDSVVPGETYRFSMNGALTEFNQNGIKFQIIQLNGPGNEDDSTHVDFTLGSIGGGQQNVFKLIDTSYTAVANDTGSLAFRFTKNWGGIYKIDNFKIECTSCDPPAPSSIENIDNIELYLYPNPSNNKIVVSSSKKIDRLEVIDIRGKLLLTEYNLQNQHTIDLTKFSSDIYFLRAITKNQMVTKKLIIK
jgi:hypothetical protein